MPSRVRRFLFYIFVFSVYPDLTKMLLAMAGREQKRKHKVRTPRKGV